MVFMYLLIGILLLLAVSFLATLYRSQAKGWFGEQLVRNTLASGLDPKEFRVLHDVTLPHRGGTTQIDHVVLSRYGIFTIETKHLAGWIFGKMGDAKWTQVLGGRKTQFQNPLRQNYAHLKALQSVTGLPEEAFRPIVVMTGKAKFRTGTPKGVLKLAQLVEWIRAIPRQVLTREALAGAVKAIEESRLDLGAETNRIHRRNVTGRGGNATTPWLRYFRRAVTIRMAMAPLKLVIALAIGWFVFSSVNSALQDLTQPKIGSGRAAIAPAPAVRTSTERPDLVNQRKVSPRSATRAVQAGRPAAIRQEQDAKQLEYEWNLNCAYSVDTDRCVCLDQGGRRASVGLERCKQLAQGGR